MVFGAGTRLTFRDYVQGTWGSFSTPAGRVDYLMTKAKLGEESDEPERQLTKSLAPVREVMEAGDLDFNQLLQRDLDDHRVAVKLIPYLLKEQAAGPAFFPPIVAVLLPFHSRRPSFFPELHDRGIIEDDGAHWREERAGNAFKVQRLVNENGELHPAGVGKLWWNRTEAQLVVLDGQHRAMALLAVERTMTNSWQTSGGARFRSFYEHQVKQIMNEIGDRSLDLTKVEVPVTVCWFPEQTGENAKPHEAARKLFVDVNREARPPSESRIILLSDAELSNILTRRMLNELRSGDEELLPLYAVEYDNPEVNSTRPARWSVLTNIHLLKASVNRCVFGPRKYLKDVKQKISGRPSPSERDSCMREQLDVTSLFPDQFEDGGFTYQRGKIGDKEFPLGKVDCISDRFAETWGRAILILLSKTAPYAAHARALTKLKEAWHVDDTALTLAHDALFGGVGVFWTLKDSFEHYKDRKNQGLPTTKSDVVRAWEALQNREGDFESYRVQEYLHSGRQVSLKLSKAAYAVFNTHACQLGMIMTLGSLWELRKTQGEVSLQELPDFANALVAGWNAYFSQEHGKANDHRLAFNKSEVTDPLNQITNMDTPQAVYFRYFWLQALDTPPAWSEINRWFIDRATFRHLVSEARELYLDFCVEQQLKALQTSRPDTPKEELKEAAYQAASKSLKKALRKWFDVDDQTFSQWLDSRRTAKTRKPLAEQRQEVSPRDNDETGYARPVTSVEELIDD